MITPSKYTDINRMCCMVFNFSFGTYPHHIILLSFHHSEEVLIITCDGRCITGILAGFDQLQNLIIKHANERVYHLPPPDEESLLEIVPLGLYLIRGDNVAVVRRCKRRCL